MKFRAVLLALAVTPSLGGCVAAALPVLAAGGVLKTQANGGANAQPERGPPRVAIDLTPPVSAPLPAQEAGAGPAPGTLVQNYTLADGTRMEVMAGPLPAAGSAPAAPEPTSSSAETPSAVPPSANIAASNAPVSSALAEEREPFADTSMTGHAATPPPATFASYDALYDYALKQGTLPIVGSERHSVLLANSGSLSATTRTCSVHPAAVLIDLDPGPAMFDPSAAISADPGLVNTLAALRAQGIAVGWITSATADRAGAVRRALMGSGLDPTGRDELALLRYPEERKQTRREDFAKVFCVVAMAGDERGDFDELFHYLKDPSRAERLDTLVGKGWFLIPQPLS